MAVASLEHERHDVDLYAPRASRVNVGRVERWLSMAAGGALAVYALKRRSIPGGTAALAGAALLYRGATGHCDLYQALGINRAPVTALARGPTRDRTPGSSSAAAPASTWRSRHDQHASWIEVYRFWRNFENLPKFMTHLDSVATREAGISHWVALGPAGMKVEWDARVINEIDNKLIAWQSLEGSMVSTAGSVNFRETDHGTEVRVKLQYNPPAGKLGAAVARLVWRGAERPDQRGPLSIQGADGDRKTSEYRLNPLDFRLIIVRHVAGDADQRCTRNGAADGPGSPDGRGSRAA